jgi:hypothetical protein
MGDTMRRTFGLAALGTVLALPMAASGTPLDYDCDVPAGHFSSIKTQVSLPIEVSGRVTPLVLRPGDYLPVGNVSIRSGDNQGVGLKVIAFNTSMTSLIVAFVDSKTPDHLMAMAKVDMSDSVSFRLTVSESGQGTLKVGQSEHAFEVDLAAPTELSISCSTGQFEFNELEWVQPAE